MGNLQKEAAHKVMIRYAESLADVYQRIEEIDAEVSAELEAENKVQGGPNRRPLFWFRGHSRSHYHLFPNIYRGAEINCDGAEPYTANHLREEYRFQHFMARNYDNITRRIPQSFIEWQEVMQHYGALTNLMDWSESLHVALEFSLEDFFKPVRDLEVEERCRTSDPAIWVLRPNMLNRAVYDSFVNNSPLISKSLQLYGGDMAMANKIADELKNKSSSGIYYSLKEEKEQNMNVLISLSSLELLRNAYRGRELEALKKLELNPFFFLLLRYYSDGLPVGYGALPPLAIIHPYHSERIKVQKGVFTVFPYYFYDQCLREINNSEIIKNPPIAMEYMSKCIPYLYKIQIMNPTRVANELMRTGTKRGGLYPEMQIIAEDLENAVL